MPLHPDLVRSAPELASLETLAGVLETTLVALVAAHPCIEADFPCSASLAPCRLADVIHNRIAELDNALLDYRASVEGALEYEDDQDELPF